MPLSDPDTLLELFGLVDETYRGHSPFGLRFR